MADIGVRRVPEVFRRSGADQAAAEQHARRREVDDEIVPRVAAARKEDLEPGERGRLAGLERERVARDAEPASRRVEVGQHVRVRADARALRGADPAHLVVVRVRDDQRSYRRADLTLDPP
ncbi:MAG TPA: hypothetical protein VFT98_18020 [Myxococcota bacterium]|nr:hypothetical protein [Myxococcota bacterium]